MAMIMEVEFCPKISNINTDNIRIKCTNSDSSFLQDLTKAIPHHFDLRREGHIRNGRSSSRVVSRAPVTQRLNECLAISTCEAVEFNLYSETGVRLQPSVQDPLDCCLCSGNAVNGGCAATTYRHMMTRGVACVRHYEMAKEDEALHLACKRCNDNVQHCIQLQSYIDITGYTELELQHALIDHKS